MSLSISGFKIKKYLIGGFLFILFVFLFDRGLFYLITTLETKFYSKNKFEKRFEKYVKDKTFTTLIFGTSRTYEGIHPCYIEKELGQRVFKETFQGKGPKYNYYFYKLYKKYAGIPKMVIYGVDYFIYNITSDTKWMARFETEVPKEHVGYFSGPLLLVKYKNRIDNFHNNLLIRLKEKEDLDAGEESVRDFIAIHQYSGLEVPKEKKKLVSKYIRNHKLQRYRRYPGIEGEYFMKLMEEWHQDKVTVILVVLPDYFGTYRTNFERKVFALHLKRLEWKYKNVFFYNYNRPQYFFFLRNRDYFNDGGWGQTNSHLSKTGAQVFNKILAKDLKKHFASGGQNPF
ncbi:MAG: hypothetical protein JSV88_12720 [Candidatus Aminicenantes bacterium]|nr:MAG: hypothetical protein JSV88_12720 [Candidatus Aminicenantes bacterium]